MGMRERLRSARELEKCEVLTRARAMLDLLSRIAKLQN
jgi:hypothetical protein